MEATVRDGDAECVASTHAHRPRGHEASRSLPLGTPTPPTRIYRRSLCSTGLAARSALGYGEPALPPALLSSLFRFPFSFRPQPPLDLRQKLTPPSLPPPLPPSFPPSFQTYLSLFMESLNAPFPVIYEKDVRRWGIPLKRFVFHPDAFSQRRPDAAVFSQVGREGERKDGGKGGRKARYQIYYLSCLIILYSMSNYVIYCV